MAPVGHGCASEASQSPVWKPSGVRHREGMGPAFLWIDSLPAATSPGPAGRPPVPLSLLPAKGKGERSHSGPRAPTPHPGHLVPQPLLGSPPPKPRGGAAAAAATKTASVSDFLGGAFVLLMLFIFPISQNTRPVPGSPWHGGGAGHAGGGGRGPRPRTGSLPPAARPPGATPRPRATEIRLLGRRSRPRRSPAEREPERPPSHPRAQLFQLRIELFLCDFKIKHIPGERRRSGIWLAGVIPDRAT